MSKKPNIIFFFTDQQRWDTVGCYGQKLDVTPNLDAMAAEGVKFENAYTCQPVCGPARAVLQTGKYAAELGCYTNGIKLPFNEDTIAKQFNQAGYETAYVGKWHLASNKDDENEDFQTVAIPPERRGGYKDYWVASDILEFTSHGYDGYMFDGDMNKVEFKGYRADCTTDFALDYLKNKKSEKPFFLMISYIEPHHQNDRKVYEGPNGSKQKFKDFEVPGDLVGREGDWKENYPDYLGCCNSLDYNLGRLRDQLKKLDMDKDTVILYTSDHGSHFKTRNYEYKRACHEACTHIPMIAFGPGFKGGKVIKDIVSLIDVPPTLLASADIEKPAYMHGNPMQTLVNETAKEWPEEAFIQISESQVGRAIRTKKWKYSVRALDKDGWKDSGSDVYTEDFLYDLDKDPHEKNNLVKDQTLKDIRAELAQRLKRRMIEAGEQEPTINPCK